MEIQYELKVEYNLETSNGNSTGKIYTHNENLYIRLMEFGCEWKGPFGKQNYYTTSVSYSSNTPELEEIKEIILDHGCQELDITIIPKELRRSHYGIIKRRVYTKKDIENADYLRLERRGFNCIAAYKQNSENAYIVRHDNKLKNKTDFGWLDVIFTPFVSSSGKEQLEAFELNGMEFVPAIYEKPEKSPKKLFQLTSVNTMPSCLLTVQNNNGDIISDDDHSGARIWNDNGYRLPVLKYNRQEVEVMGEFDIAKTKELIGNMPQQYKHHYIVSQKFRQCLEKMKVKGVDYVPVELVD